MSLNKSISDSLALIATPDPYPGFRHLRDHEPTLWDSDRKLWVVSRYEDARFVMGSAELFSSRAMATAVTQPGRYAASPVDPDAQTVSIIGTDGAEHSRLRGILNRAFTPRRIESLRRRTTEITNELLDGLEGHPTVELQHDFADRIPIAVIAHLFDVPSDHLDAFRRWAEAMLLAVFGAPTEYQAHEIAECLTEMNTWLDDIIASRGAERGDDVISTLLRAEDAEDGLTHDEMKVFVFTVLVAGSITTSFLIGNGLLVLARQPELVARLASDPTLVPAFVEEVLRYDSPAQLMVRTATRPTLIAGTPISEGDTIAALIGSANRDDRAFPEPDTFRLDRGPTAHIAFGYGPHYCLGAALARLEARIAFERFTATRRRIDLVGPITYFDSDFFRGPVSIQANAERIR